MRKLKACKAERITPKSCLPASSYRAGFPRKTWTEDFLYKDTKELYGKIGNPSIDPVVFFKLLLTGYQENITSDRKLVEHCSMRIDVLYFLGFDIDEELPWHSTISRTRQLYPTSLFAALFNKVFT